MVVDETLDTVILLWFFGQFVPATPAIGRNTQNFRKNFMVVTARTVEAEITPSISPNYRGESATAPEEANLDLADTERENALTASAAS